MRSVITIATITVATLASAMLVMSSVGHAQNNQSQGKNQSLSEDSFYPSPAEEDALPYYPCNTNVELSDGRHVCLDGGRRPVAPSRGAQ
jgi:hypothetical protein